MAMIIIGIILMVLGAGGLGYGIYLNNDTMARLESFLNSGNTNPGTIL